VPLEAVMAIVRPFVENAWGGDEVLRRLEALSP
jgi:hypothetical protein